MSGSTESLRNPLGGSARWALYQASTWTSVVVIAWTARDVAITALAVQGALGQMAAANVLVQRRVRTRGDGRG